MKSLSLTCLALLLVIGLAQAGTYEAAASQAGVTSVQNRVERRSATTSWSPCRVGDLLSAGDSLRTGAQSSATLLLDDLSSLRLAPNTQITVVSLMSGQESLAAQFGLDLGRAWVHANPEHTQATTFELKGPNAVAAVKGTAFEMNVQGTETLVRVWEGSVSCRKREASELIQAQGRHNAFRATPDRCGGELISTAADAWQTWNQTCDHSVAVAMLDQPSGSGGSLESAPPSTSKAAPRTADTAADKKGNQVPTAQIPVAARASAKAPRHRVRRQLTRDFLVQMGKQQPAPPPVGNP